MYLINRGRLGGAALGDAPGGLPTISALRAILTPRLKKLGSYDLFLRDRSVLEWFKDNSAIVHWLVRTPDSRQHHEESHAFWTHLSTDERKALVAKWIELMEAGAKLAGDGKAGGVGAGYALTETAPPSKAQAVSAWASAADAFVGRFEGVRQKKRIAARADSSPPGSITSLLEHYGKVGTVIAVGAVGLLAVVLLVELRGRR